VRIERENLNHRKEKIRQAFHKLEEIAFSLIR